LKEKIQSWPTQPIPQEVDNLYWIPQIHKIPFMKNRDFFGDESVFQRGAKQKVLVELVHFRQGEKEILEIDPDTGFFSEEGPEIEPDSHFEVMYAHKQEKSREGKPLGQLVLASSQRR
jgi:hypothetical protein